MFVVIGTRDLKNETPFIDSPPSSPLPFPLLEKCREGTDMYSALLLDRNQFIGLKTQ